MRMFPLFVDIEGKRVILAGGGRALEEKIQKLLPYGARIEVFSPDAPPGYEEAGVCVCRASLKREHLDPPPVFVIAAGAGEEENARISRLCREMGVPVNAADDPERCSFFFPSLITRGGMTIAVSTSGKSPAAASALRERIEGAVPENMDAILDWAQELRVRMKSEIHPSVRRSVLKKAVALAMERERPLTEAETEEIILAARTEAVHG